MCIKWKGQNVHGVYDKILPELELNMIMKSGFGAGFGGDYLHAQPGCCKYVNGFCCKIISISISGLFLPNSGIASPISIPVWSNFDYTHADQVTQVLVYIYFQLYAIRVGSKWN